MNAAPTVRHLRPSGVAWRLTVTAAALAGLTLGQVHDTNDYFPLGSLSQYGSAHDLNGTVNSTYLLADTESGERVRVPLNPRGVGVGRADIEAQLGRILDDPSLLQGIANAWADLHPEADRYVELYVMRDTYQLVDGVQQGAPRTTQLTSWKVRP